MTGRDWLEKAKKENFAIGAFNVDSLDILKGVCIAAQKQKSPIILEFSQGEVDYFGLKNVADLVANAREEYEIPILLNLDHSKSVDNCLEAIEAGFDLIHFDGSELPIDENKTRAAEVVRAAHEKGLLVEGEIDKVPGSSEVHKEEIDLEFLKKSYTKPEQAKEFADAAGVDIFAAVFGNVHGTFAIEPELDFELLKKVRETLPDKFLSMHGGSGISAENVREGIKVGGIVKVNINTEIRQTFIEALKEKVNEEPTQYTYYKLANDISLAVAALIEDKIDVLGSAGKVE
ncbi:class II fructose-bisphosphate aldolase [Candidatus Curtissbacteria bacterium]|nr:class II fructose-bisphosphate aldolase [Candidatus Curtissbacteria bacterium]